MKTKIGLLGGNGKMGMWVQRLLATEFAARGELVAEVSRGESFEALRSADVIIDFSSPDALLSCLNALSTADPMPAIVSGSTGWTDAQRDELRAHAQERFVLLHSANFSGGVAAFSRILRMVSPLLQKFGYHPRMVETHHVHKKDTPSGTALSLQRELAPTWGDRVPCESIRSGEVIGDHAVIFEGVADTITLTHSAQDRSIFARGAIECAFWLAEHRARLAGERRLLSLDDCLFHFEGEAP